MECCFLQFEVYYDQSDETIAQQKYVNYILIYPSAQKDREKTPPLPIPNIPH